MTKKTQTERKKTQTERKETQLKQVGREVTEPVTIQENRKGRISQKETEEIRQLASYMLPQEIAKKIGRTEESVRQVLGEVKTKYKWKHLEEEFTVEEMGFFKERYDEMVGQFRGDIFSSEEAQVFQLLRLEILMHRNMVSRRKAVEDAQRAEELAKQLIEKGEVTDSLSAERLVNAAREAEKVSSSEYYQLQGRYNELAKHLKATRDQRLSKVESSKDTFVALVKRLQDNQSKSEIHHRITSLRLAEEKERERLSGLHQYQDGMKDRPFLTPESVLIDSQDCVDIDKDVLLEEENND